MTSSRATGFNGILAHLEAATCGDPFRVQRDFANSRDGGVLTLRA